jgi:hypothetical protein
LARGREPAGHVALIGVTLNSSVSPRNCPMKNRRDEDGWPICPVCEESIKPGESVGRPDDYMVHIRCYREARERERQAPPPSP